MSEEYIDLNLTVACQCIDDDGDAYSFCNECGGDGEVLTEEGRKLLRFLRKFMFKELPE